MLSPRQKKDKIVRSTDLDALSCRHSCNQQGYFDPQDRHIAKLVASYARYLPFCAGYTSMSASRTIKQMFDRKLPLINRGTYLRTRAISAVVAAFAKTGGQIVSMGGGSDTRAFSVLEHHKNIKYVEIDFPETTRIKKLTIASDSELSGIVGVEERVVISSKDEFHQLDPDIIAGNYCLLGVDLRDTETLRRKLVELLDVEKPTLVVSECVLCYLSPDENSQILKLWTDTFSNVSMVIYEPVSLNDSFGKTMEANLQSRGINLLTFNELPTLDAKVDLLKHNGFERVRATDLSSVGGYSKDQTWFQNEILRINRLELIDEVEEINLLLAHYCLVYGEKGRTVEEINDWNWKVSAN